MTLSLPETVEQFIPEGGEFSDLHQPGCYALLLSRPDDLGAAWDRVYDVRPDYFDRLQSANEVVYLGESGDVLTRIEEHRDGEVRVGALQKVCSIEDVRNIWFMDSKDEAEQEESRLALMLQNEYPNMYVHSR